MRIEPRQLDAILSDLVDCALVGADFYLTQNTTDTSVKAIYPISAHYVGGSWHVVAAWRTPLLDRQFRIETPITFKEAEAIIKSMHELHGGKI